MIESETWSSDLYLTVLHVSQLHLSIIHVLKLGVSVSLMSVCRWQLHRRPDYVNGLGMHVLALSQNKYTSHFLRVTFKNKLGI
jgi:hypothetical protein